MTSGPTQVQICVRHGSDYFPPEPRDKLGIALGTLDILPLNALRHPIESGISGWYIWGGEMSADPQFFKPMHVHHLADYAGSLLPYLALAPGWRVLLAPGQTDVWYDANLLNV